MSLPLIILPTLAMILLVLAIYEWHVSRQIERLAQRVHDAMDCCQTVWVHITWRGWREPWDMTRWTAARPCGCTSPGAGGASHGSCTQQI